LGERSERHDESALPISTTLAVLISGQCSGKMDEGDPLRAPKGGVSVGVAILVGAIVAEVAAANAVGP
jgi:hypothetical protein